MFILIDGYLKNMPNDIVTILQTRDNLDANVSVLDIYTGAVESIRYSEAMRLCCNASGVGFYNTGGLCPIKEYFICEALNLAYYPLDVGGLLYRRGYVYRLDKEVLSVSKDGTYLLLQSNGLHRYMLIDKTGCVDAAGVNITGAVMFEAIMDLNSFMRFCTMQ